MYGFTSIWRSIIRGCNVRCQIIERITRSIYIWIIQTILENWSIFVLYNPNCECEIFGLYNPNDASTYSLTWMKQKCIYIKLRRFYTVALPLHSSKTSVYEVHWCLDCAWKWCAFWMGLEWMREKWGNCCMIFFKKKMVMHINYDIVSYSIIQTLKIRSGL